MDDVAKLLREVTANSKGQTANVPTKTKGELEGSEAFSTKRRERTRTESQELPLQTSGPIIDRASCCSMTKRFGLSLSSLRMPVPKVSSLLIPVRSFLSSSLGNIRGTQLTDGRGSRATHRNGAGQMWTKRLEQESGLEECKVCNSVSKCMMLQLHAWQQNIWLR